MGACDHTLIPEMMIVSSSCSCAHLARAHLRPEASVSPVGGGDFNV